MPASGQGRAEGEKNTVLDLRHPGPPREDLLRGRSCGLLRPAGVAEGIDGLVPVPVYPDTADEIQIGG